MRSGDNPKELVPLKVPTRAGGDRRATVRRIAPDLVWHRRLFGATTHNTTAGLGPANAIAVEVEVKLNANALGCCPTGPSSRCSPAPRQKLEWYTKDLRLPGSASPGRQPLGTVHLPDPIKKSPYQHGLARNVAAEGVTVHVFTKDMARRGQRLDAPIGYRWHTRA